MKYLLDTDHVSILQRPTSAEYLTLVARMTRHPRTDIGTSVVSFHEQSIGFHGFLNRAKRPAEVIRGYRWLQEVLDAYASAVVVPFDAAAAAAFDQLSASGLALMDRRIAATAVSRGLTLLTRNRSDFARVPGLVLEDWTV